MATEVIKTVRLSDGDYTSLNAWESGEQRDLVSADEIAVAQIEGNWSGSKDGTPVVLDGWTTDATRYIKIMGYGDAKQNGKWDETKYILGDTSVNNVSKLHVSASYTKIQDIQIYAYTQTWLIGGIVVGGPITNIEVDRCIIRGKVDATQYNMAIGIVNGINANVTASNCIAFESSGASWGFYTDGTSGVNAWMLCRNCTVYDWSTGFRAASSGLNTYFNCLAQACSVKCFDGNAVNISTNNVSSDATAPAVKTYYRNTEVAFVDAANGDFHLTGSIGMGADLYSVSSASYTTDIDGNTRTGTWDVGADQYYVYTPPSGHTVLIKFDYDNTRLSVVNLNENPDLLVNTLMSGSGVVSVKGEFIELEGYGRKICFKTNGNLEAESFFEKE